MLQFHRFEDWFTLEVGWSDQGKWPASAPIPQSESERPASGELRFRIGYLWKKTDRDHWWEFAPRHDVHNVLAPDVPTEDILPKAESLVRDAVGRVRDRAVPYFELVASEQEGENVGGEMRSDGD
jgi:hypothetical protein